MLKSKRLLALLLALLTFFSIFALAPKQVNAGVSSAKALINLKTIVIDGTLYEGKQTDNYTGKNIGNREYKRSGGGYWTYRELTNWSSGKQIKSSTTVINMDRYDDLTSGQKQNFLKDVFKCANAAAYYKVDDISDETVTDLYNELQTYNGMGSQLMASLLSETKPDYATANRIYKPFSGVVGTILGFLSIIIMALIGVTMALDLCYITIPAFQLIMGAEKDGSGSGNGATKFAAKLISTEAQKAVQVSQNDGQNGEFKAAVGIYFKYRWKGLVILGICLLYLVQGQIWTFVAWVIDLLSGFLGF